MTPTRLDLEAVTDDEIKKLTDASLERDAFGNFVIPNYEFEPVYIGPTWARGEDGKFLLPRFTLGYQAIQWAEDHLLNDKGEPWRFTGEQRRFLLWWYEVDGRGVWVTRDGILQRLKGWGKDPLAAVMSLIEMIGPCRFKGFATESIPSKGIWKGQPVAQDNNVAWVQVAAVSKKQTENTMLCFGWMVSDDLKKKYRMTVNKESVYAYGGKRKIQAVTSNPRTLEGGRPTFTIRNEPHHWVLSNEGHEMAAVISRNLAKSPGGTARALSITNAYAPHEDSVAQRQREAWEAEDAGLAVKTGVMYDSVEADPSISLVPPRPKEIKSEDHNELYGEMTKAWIGAILQVVRGDAHWLDVERLTLQILDKNNPISESKRFYLNVITTSEDTWLAADAIKAMISLEAADNRESMGRDNPRAGWLPMPDEPIVMFGDGSKSDDSTGLVGVRVSDGYTFQIGVWQKPPGKRGDTWLAPRQAVDARVREAFKRFNIVAFWFDPSHAKDDIDSSRYWDTMIDEWMRDFAPVLDKKVWATKSGHGGHAIMFDMTSTVRQAMFVAAAEVFVEEAERVNDVEEFRPAFQICGTPAFVNHLRNARKYPTAHGESLSKEGRESGKKIDLAVCAVGGQMLRRIFLNSTADEAPPRKGTVWGAY